MRRPRTSWMALAAALALAACATPGPTGTPRTLLQSAALGADGTPLLLLDYPHYFDRAGNPYLAGFYRVGESLLYVNRGVGSSSVPIRAGAPAAVTSAPAAL